MGATRHVSFTVLEGFAGVASSTIVVMTRPAAQRCGISFAIGKEYVVYADRQEGGALTTSRCSGTREVEDAAADLAYARAVKQGHAPSGFIGGTVSVSARTLTGKSVGTVALPPAIAVTVSHDDATDTTVTERGEFRVASRGAGTYRVSVSVPEQFYSEAPEATVTLRDTRSCANVGVALHDNGHVTGRVVDSAGRPVAGLTMDLGTTGSGPGRRTVTDRDGRYTLTRIPSGRFLLSVPGDSLRVFFPGVTTMAAARRVAVGSGERVNLDDFRIPAHEHYTPVSGTVFDADGAPAEGARVYLKGAGEHEQIISEPVAVDFMGRFVIAARAGMDYWLFAERPRLAGRSSRADSTDQVRLTVTTGMKPLRLTLARRY